MTAPVLDRRTYDDVLRQLLDEARRRASVWNPDAQDDVGRVLAVIYAHYVELLLERLNRVPDKHKLAFLDLLGVSLLPPGVARAPIVFTPGPTAGQVTRVARGTQVATAQTETDPAVTFETDADLNVVDAVLANAFTIDPERDWYADRSAVVRGEDELTFDPFRGDRPLAHEVYLGTDPSRPYLLSQPGRLFVDVLGGTVDVGETADVEALKWAASSEGGWEELATPKLLSVENGVRLSFPSVRGPRAAAHLAPAGLPQPLERSWLRASAERVALPALQVKLLRVRPSTTTRPAAVWAEEPSPPGEQPTTQPTGDIDAPFNPFVNHAETCWFVGTEGFDERYPWIVLVPHVDNPVDRQFLDQTKEAFWEYYGFEAEDDSSLGWFPLQKGSVTPRETVVVDDTWAFQLPQPILIRRPATIALTALAGDVSGYWIRTQLNGNFQSAVAPRIVPFVVRGFAPDAGSDGNGTIDITKPFEPFGALPGVNDAFYLASREAFGQRNATAYVFLTLSEAGRPTPGLSMDDIPHEHSIPKGEFRLAWEYFGENGWTLFCASAVRFTGNWQQGFADIDRDLFRRGSAFELTRSLQQDGIVRFSVPDDIAETEIAGVRSFWIRVRIARGDYGRPTEFVPTGNETMPLRPKLDTGNLAAPAIASVLVAYDYDDSPVDDLTVVTHNAFDWADRTDELDEAFASPLLVPLDEDGPTFYLGFDRELPNSAVNLYFAVPPRQLVERITPAREARGDHAHQRTDGADDIGDAERLRWEYWNGATWARLVVIDDTHDLTEPGVVQFLGPVDFAERALFEEPLRRWLRIVLVNPDEDYAARLEGVFVNGVEAMQSRTIAREVIGSSSGGANQRIRASSPPILPGQELWVREPERPPADELRRIQAEEGPSAIELARTDAALAEIWIRWHEVRSFARSGPHDRHYLVDRIPAEFVFGNGEHAVIPPAGVDNLAVSYRSGGTERGNRDAGAVSQLKTSLPPIETATNPIPASGGSEAETLAGVLERGPQTLKHRGRAITCEDYEWLARQASGTTVARARCIPTRSPELEFDPGWVTLILVPAGREKKLLPSAELVRLVARYLERRVPAILLSESPAHVNVVGPGYVPVELAIEINPVSFNEADAVRERVLTAVDGFLHPLTGGPDGTGWEFGRDVYLSEIFAALEQLAGVEHVHSLQFKPTAATVSGRIAGTAPDPLVAFARLTAQSAEGEVTVRVVEDLRAGADELMVTLFREGERIGLWSDADTTRDPTVELTISRISGDVLTVDPFRAAPEYPVGTLVASLDGASSSFLVAPIATGTRVQTLRVRLFEAAWFALGAERLRIPDLHLPYSGNHTILASQA
jgi:Baseplate J-like protein